MKHFTLDYWRPVVATVLLATLALVGTPEARATSVEGISHNTLSVTPGAGLVTQFGPAHQSEFAWVTPGSGNITQSQVLVFNGLLNNTYSVTAEMRTRVALNSVGKGIALGLGYGAISVANPTQESHYLGLSFLSIYSLIGTGTTNPALTDWFGSGIGNLVLATEGDYNLLDDVQGGNWSNIHNNVSKVTKNFDLRIGPPDYGVEKVFTYPSIGLDLGPGDSITFHLISGAGAAAAATPEPSTMMLMGTGIVGLVAWRLRKPRGE